MFAKVAWDWGAIKIAGEAKIVPGPRPGLNGGRRRAPVAPDLAVGGFDVLGEARSVGEGGLLQALAEGGTEVGQAGAVVGHRYGNMHILIGGVGDEFGGAEASEEADADAGDVGLAGAGDDGDAHEEG